MIDPMKPKEAVTGNRCPHSCCHGTVHRYDQAKEILVLASSNGCISIPIVLNFFSIYHECCPSAIEISMMGNVARAL